MKPARDASGTVEDRLLTGRSASRGSELTPQAGRELMLWAMAPKLRAPTARITEDFILMVEGEVDVQKLRRS